MSRQNSREKYSSYQRNSKSHHSRRNRHQQRNISQAETSEDDRHEKHRQFKKQAQFHQRQKFSQSDSYNRSNKYIKLQSPSKFDSKKMDHSLTLSLEKSQDLTGRKKIFQEKERETIKEKPYIEKDRHQYSYPLSPDEIDSKATNIMKQIQSFNFELQNFEESRQKLLNVCGSHVRLVDQFPESLDKVGDQLIRNGHFHVKWSQSFLKSKSISSQSLINKYFFRFRQKITKGTERFEKTFNLTNKEKEVQNDDTTFKRYRRQIEESTKSTTKMDTMILYHQVKSEMRDNEIKQGVEKEAQISIEKWRSRIAKEQLNFHPISDLDLMFEDEDTVTCKWKNAEEQQNKKQAIKKLQAERIRQRSPLSNRFRMMHQCQTNERRLQVQMACLFLKIEKFYFLNDLQIVKIEESIFSPNQEIIVLKAYTIEFCPKMDMMKLEPQVRNLIAVYKFCGLSELVRLEKTYGAFDGIIVYAQSFDINKYLTNNKEISLIKDDFLKQVKEQLPVGDEDSYDGYY